MSMRSVRAVPAGLLLAAGLALVTPSGAAQAQVATQTVVTGMARPLFMLSPPGDFQRRFVLEQWTGQVRILNAQNQLLPTPFLTVTGLSLGSEQGLLGLAFHPNFATNGRFFVSFTNTSGVSVVREHRVSAGNPNVADATPVQTIITQSQPFSNHNGGWIDFGPDGFLYIAWGDGGSGGDPQNNGQNINSLLGKTLRIDVNGDDFPSDPNRNYRIPAGNPFAGATAGADEVWHWGLRNHWRNAFDRVTGDLWIADVGQNNIEEINRVPNATSAGANFGWRCYEGNSVFNATGCGPIANYIFPVTQYSHASGRCSITGGYVYRGCAIPSLSGLYIYADYCTSEIWSYNPVTNATVRLFDLTGNILSFGQDNWGELYVLFQGGTIQKLVPSTPVSPDCNANGTPDACDISVGASRDRNVNRIPDECEACLADLNNDGETTFDDIQLFVTLFNSSDPRTDYNRDGEWTFDDIQIFVGLYNEGCRP